LNAKEKTKSLALKGGGKDLSLGEGRPWDNFRQSMVGSFSQPRRRVKHVGKEKRQTRGAPISKMPFKLENSQPAPASGGSCSIRPSQKNRHSGKLETFGGLRITGKNSGKKESLRKIFHREARPICKVAKSQRAGVWKRGIEGTKGVGERAEKGTRIHHTFYLGTRSNESCQKKRVGVGGPTGGKRLRRKRGKIARLPQGRVGRGSKSQGGDQVPLGEGRGRQHKMCHRHHEPQDNIEASSWGREMSTRPVAVNQNSFEGGGELKSHTRDRLI